MTCEFPAQMASNMENVSIWWHHHEPRAYITRMFFFYTSQLISWLQNFQAIKFWLLYINKLTQVTCCTKLLVTVSFYFGMDQNNALMKCELWKTRQHSTQSVGNMSPPSPRHLLPHVLEIVPRNPKYDQFQPKGHHNQENPQSTTKMPGNPKFYLFH